MQDTIHSVFLAGREWHARLRQIAAGVVALAALLHLTAFVGYTRTVHDADAAKANLRRMERAAEGAEAVERGLAGLDEALVPAVKRILGSLLTAMQQDFAELSEAVNDAVRQDLKSSAARDAARPRLEIQQGPVAQAEITEVRRRLADRTVQAKIRDVKTNDELRAALDPIIADAIVKRRFGEANAAWTAHVEQTVRPAAAAVSRSIAATALASGAAGLRWTELTESVGRCAAAAGKLRFNPPAAGDWWKTRSGKAGVIDALEHEAARALVDADAAATLSDELTESAEAARAEAEELDLAFEARRVEIEEQAKRQVEAIASLAKPLGLVAVDLGSLVRWFPLVIGGALAAAAFLGTEGRRGYRDALDLVAVAAREDAAWTRVVEQSRSALRRGPAQWLLWLGVALAWTGLAALRIASLGQATPGRAALVAAMGVAVVAAALAHRSFVERR